MLHFNDVEDQVKRDFSVERMVERLVYNNIASKASQVNNTYQIACVIRQQNWHSPRIS